MNRTERQKEVTRHNNFVEGKYGEEVQRCIANTVFYDNRTLPSFNYKSGTPEIEVMNTDTVSAIFSVNQGKVCALNFASAKHPGGGYINGSMAQEEALCHSSFLYQVLKPQKLYTDFYQQNLADDLNGIYHCSALYSKNIRFFSEEKSKKSDVITCPAPNYSTKKFSAEQNTMALMERMEMMGKILEMQKFHDTLILGAWGCGVFGQNASDVSKLFQQSIKNGVFNVNKIIFAIPTINDSYNYDKFAETLKKGGER